MCITSLKVNMLGGLSIQSGGAEINDSDNRSRKVWLLLAYMIYCRKRPVTQEELVRLLWDGGDNVTNPANALKTMFHRVRTTLDRLGDSAGHILIVRQGGSYAWNCKVPLTLDVEEFDELCQAASDATRPKERLERYLKALELYNGDFLAHFSSDPWVVPVAAYYHNIYLQVVHEVLPMLEEADRREEAALLCRQAVERTQHGVVLGHRRDHAVAAAHHAIDGGVERRGGVGRKAHMISPRAAQQARELGTATVNRTSGIEGTRRGAAPGIAERAHRLRHGIDDRLRLVHGRRRVIQVDHRTTSHISITV